MSSVVVCAASSPIWDRGGAKRAPPPDHCRGLLCSTGPSRSGRPVYTQATSKPRCAASRGTRSQRTKTVVQDGAVADISLCRRRTTRWGACRFCYSIRPHRDSSGSATVHRTDAAEPTSSVEMCKLRNNMFWVLGGQDSRQSSWRLTPRSRLVCRSRGRDGRPQCGHSRAPENPPPVWPAHPAVSRFCNTAWPTCFCRPHRPGP